MRYPEVTVSSFVPECGIARGFRSLEKSQFLTSDAGIVGDADTAVLVESNCCDLASASSSVLVVTVVPWHRVVVVVIDIPAGLVVVIQCQVGMIRLYAVVQDRHNDTLACVALLPGRAKIHVVAIFRSAVLEDKGNRREILSAVRSVFLCFIE